MSRLPAPATAGVNDTTAARGAPGAIDPSADRPSLAVGLYLLAAGVFTIMDALAKQLTLDGFAPEQVIALRYLLVTLALIPVVAWRWREWPLKTSQPALHVARGALLIGAATLFVYAIRTLPLATATSISFVSPLFVTILSILFLKEQVGLRRWAAIAVGFVGVLAILRPGAATFQFAMLLPMAASFCWASSLIITRAMKGRESAFAILVWSTGAGLVVIAPLGLLNWRPLDANAMTIIALLAVCHVAAQLLVIRAFMLSAASSLAPFSYTTLIWATLIGYFFFDALPDLPTLAGAAVLAAAGLYVWHRERLAAARARKDSTE